MYYYYSIERTDNNYYYFIYKSIMTTGVASFDIGLFPHYPKLNITKYYNIVLLHKQWHHWAWQHIAKCNFHHPTSCYWLSSQDETTQYNYFCGWETIPIVLYYDIDMNLNFLKYWTNLQHLKYWKKWKVKLILKFQYTNVILSSILHGHKWT